MKFKKNKFAHMLLDTLLTLAIIAVIASLTLPPLLDRSESKHIIENFLNFNDTLEQSVKQWKSNILCIDDAYTCLTKQNLSDDNCANFDQIAKYMQVGEKISNTANSEGVFWLPEQTYEYNGDMQTGNLGGVSKLSTGTCRYVFLNGMTMSVDVDPAGFNIQVDVNGKRPPNRMGKDTFPFIIGNIPGQDIYYYPYYSQPQTNTEGLCMLPASNCDPNNYDPTVKNGASITTYMILNHKLPDFERLSQTVQGFKP